MADAPAPDRIPVTIELTPAQKQALERRAEAQGVSLERIVVAALDRELAAAASNGEEADIEAQPGSFLDTVPDLAGSVDSPDGPSDLATHPKHMEGYGRS
jgi:hypothetical protein